MSVPLSGYTRPGEIARVEHRGDARDVRLQGEREQVELDLDVLVERLRHAVRHVHARGTSVEALPAIARRRSISRTSSMYCSSRTRSVRDTSRHAGR